MPLSGSSPLHLHLLQNIFLIALSISFLPLCTSIAVLSYLVSPYTTIAKKIKHKRQWRANSSNCLRPRVILVTGVGMCKGLSIARAFYIEGHIVVGADFEPHGIPICGRFSAAFRKFYRLTKPVSGPGGEAAYTAGLIDIIKKENVELWISCSGVASALEDARAAETVEKLTSCKVVQFGADITDTLHEKNTFIQQAQEFGLNAPETTYVTSVGDAMAQLYADGRLKGRSEQFIMKSVGLDDSIRADMTTLPRSSPAGTKSYLEYLRPSASRPFVIQRFIRGPEYCTHSLIVRGRVVLFTACPSAELLMHYEALPPSKLSKAMLKYTEVYAERMGTVTGHFSIDFILDESESEPDLMKRLYPIECNPRAHTAVVLLEAESERMVEAYLGVLGDERDLSVKQTSVTTSAMTGYYWIGHDVVAHLLLPLLSVLTSRSSVSSAAKNWATVFNHVVFWKDGTYTSWDPWPFWCLYCVYWPGMFCASVLTSSWWSRCNVSTTKIFRC